MGRLTRYRPARCADLLLTAGRMSSSTRQTILDAVNAVPATQPASRVQTAVALTMISPDFIVQK